MKPGRLAPTYSKCLFCDYVNCTLPSGLSTLIAVASLFASLVLSFDSISPGGVFSQAFLEVLGCSDARVETEVIK